MIGIAKYMTYHLEVYKAKLFTEIRLQRVPFAQKFSHPWSTAGGGCVPLQAQNQIDGNNRIYYQITQSLFVIPARCLSQKSY
jgi:hypothetical protein